MSEPAVGGDVLPSPETPRERVAHAMYATVERAAMTLPESWGRHLFTLGGAAAFHLLPGSRAVVERNLSRVLGPAAGPEVLRAASKEAFLSYARYWYDTFRVRTLPDEEFMARFRGEGDEHLAAAVEAGKGGIVAVPHLGNWDGAGKRVHLKGWRITAVAEVLRPERLFRLFLEHRKALGMGIVPLYDDHSVAQELVRLLAQNELIALVADRDLKGNGVQVEMFGENRLLPAGPALLSLATGAPLLPCSVYDEGDGWVMLVEPPLKIERTDSLRNDVTALTRALAVRFERAIAAAPTQWHMFQPAWPSDEVATPPGAGAGPGRVPSASG